MDGVEEEDYFYYAKFVRIPKWGHREFRPLTPNSARTGENCETAKIIHVNYQKQHNKVVRPTPMFKLRLDHGCTTPDSSGAAKENWGENQ